MVKKSATNLSHANKGKVFEEVVEKTNDLYRKKGLALIHYVPSEWLPIRDNSSFGKNKIVSAKITRQAVVDFVGVSIKGGPVAFDVKSTSDEDRWPYSDLPENQFAFLNDHKAICDKGNQFILLFFAKYDICYLVELDFLAPRWQEWKRQKITYGKAKKGYGSLSLQELEQNNLPKFKLGYPLDYLLILPTVNVNFFHV